MNDSLKPLFPLPLVEEILSKLLYLNKPLRLKFGRLLIGIILSKRHKMDRKKKKKRQICSKTIKLMEEMKGLPMQLMSRRWSSSIMLINLRLHKSRKR